MRTWMLCAAAAVLAATPLLAAEEKETSLKDLAAIADAVKPSLVKTEFTLQYDKGETPPGYYVIAEERPMEEAGYLVSPTQVVCEDPLIEPRFIKSIAVRFGEEVIDASPAGYARDDHAMLLQLAHSPKDAKPLTFNADAKPPLFSVTYTEGADWTIRVGGAAMRLEQTDSGRAYSPQSNAALYVDKSGVCAGVAMRTRLPMDEAWKGSPAQWTWITDETMQKDLGHLEQVVEQGVLRVTLKFRSPKAQAEQLYARQDENAEAMQGGEMNVSGVLVDDRVILICADLKPKATARLESIQVHAGTETVDAKFGYSLRDYGALVAYLAEPVRGAVKLADDNILDLQDRLLLSADVRVQGETQVNYLWHARLHNVTVGWRKQLYPDIESRENTEFLFDADGALFALPIAHREKVSEEHRYGSNERLTDVAYLKPVLEDVAKYADANNVPLTEEAENRLAWIGVELQPLNQDLARANKVSDLTQDGQTGALVTYVYPNSPAAKDGLVQGDILLRLRIEGEPTPVDVKVEADRFAEGFPWDRYDELPEEYYDRIPHPWPSIENDLTRKLTDAGFGKKYTAEAWHDGKVVEKPFEIVESPPQYDSAPRYKAAALGLTVRDLTYEVRRYFQKGDKDAGVIASKVEPGSKASVAGIKPYEIITQVNDQPVMTVKDFEKAVQGQTELRLSVERMNKGRIVKITVAAEKAQNAPATPATPAE